MRYRIPMASPIVEEVAEVIGSASVCWIGSDGRFQHRHLLQPPREDVGRISNHRPRVECGAGLRIPAQLRDRSAGVQFHCSGASRENLLRMVEQTSTDAVESQIQPLAGVRGYRSVFLEM